MARIAGVDLPRNKHANIALTYIYGIGTSRAARILDEAKVDPMKNVQDLGEDEVNRIRQVIEGEGGVEGDLRKDVTMNIKRLIEIGSYRGFRHRRNLPVRGQRTHTNARTRKGPRKGTVAQKKKERKHVPHGLVHVQASFNNTIVTFTDMTGNVLAWKSSGSLGFRGSRKGTPFAAQQAAMNAANMARDHGVRSVDVRVSGPGSGRESAVRALSAAGIEVRSIKDATPIPHNGCRPPKRRRV